MLKDGQREGRMSWQDGPRVHRRGGGGEPTHYQKYKRLGTWSTGHAHGLWHWHGGHNPLLPTTNAISPGESRFIHTRCKWAFVAIFHFFGP